MLRRRSLVPLALLASAPLATAQEIAARFDAPVVAVNRYRRLDLLLELDGDGYQDAIGFWYGAQEGKNEVTGFRNRHDGSFDEKWQVLQDYVDYPNYKEALAGGDLDRDGIDDFVIA